ncbi:MAG: glycosyltransferase family 2 protein [bacterium]
MSTGCCLMDVSIIIVNHDTRAFLKRCLRSVIAFPPSCKFETIVVDNASGDGSAEMVKSEFPHVRLLENRTNVGFSGALNRGIRRSAGNLLLLLNPDVIMAPGCVEALGEFLERHPDAGICGPKLLNPDGSIQLSCRAFPTPVNVFFGRRSIWNRLFPRNRISRFFLKSDMDYGAVQEVDWIMGACMMVRRRVIDSIGLFDEDYFLFVEDADFCYRSKKAGYSVFFVPDGVATHERGASTRKSFVMSTYNHNVGMYKFFGKHYDPNPALRAALGLGLAVRLLLVIPVEGISRSLR